MYDLLSGKNLVCAGDDLDEDDPEFKEAKREEAKKKREEGRKQREEEKATKKAEKKAEKAKRKEDGRKSKKGGKKPLSNEMIVDSDEATKRAPELMHADIDEHNESLKMDVDGAHGHGGEGTTTEDDTSDGGLLTDGTTDGSAAPHSDYEADKSMGSSPSQTRSSMMMLSQIYLTDRLLIPSSNSRFTSERTAGRQRRRPSNGFSPLVSQSNPRCIVPCGSGFFYLSSFTASSQNPSGNPSTPPQEVGTRRVRGQRTGKYTIQVTFGSVDSRKLLDSPEVDRTKKRSRLVEYSSPILPHNSTDSMDGEHRPHSDRQEDQDSSLQPHPKQEREKSLPPRSIPSAEAKSHQVATATHRRPPSVPTVVPQATVSAPSLLSAPAPAALAPPPSVPPPSSALPPSSPPPPSPPPPSSAAPSVTAAVAPADRHAQPKRPCIPVVIKAKPRKSTTNRGQPSTNAIADRHSEFQALMETSMIQLKDNGGSQSTPSGLLAAPGMCSFFILRHHTDMLTF
jgi:hypothetical protein